jgi:enoyl-CoA hydratase/carnithine racemase
VNDLELSVQGEIAFLQLKRAAQGNTLRGATFDQLRKAALRLADAPPRFVVLHGEGADFCAGLETDPNDALYEALRGPVLAKDAYRTQEIVGRLRSAVDAVGRLACPIVAAIEGRCHGAGLALALIADLRVATTAASFRFAEAQAGLVTGLGGLTRLTLLLGGSRATDLALTGSELDARAAAAMGLVDRVCPPGAALTTALDVVQEMRRSSVVARQQSLVAIRAIRNAATESVAEHETQAAARTWIAGEWQARADAAKGQSEG